MPTDWSADEDRIMAEYRGETRYDPRPCPTCGDTATNKYGACWTCAARATRDEPPTVEAEPDENPWPRVLAAEVLALANVAIGEVGAEPYAAHGQPHLDYNEHGEVVLLHCITQVIRKAIRVECEAHAQAEATVSDRLSRAVTLLGRAQGLVDTAALVRQSKTSETWAALAARFRRDLHALLAP